MKPFEFPEIKVVKLMIDDVIAYSNPLDEDDLGEWN